MFKCVPLAFALQELLEAAQRRRQGEGGGCSPVGPAGVCQSPAGLGEHPLSPRQPPRLASSKGSFVTAFTRARVPCHKRWAMVNECSAHLGPYRIPFLSSPNSVMINKKKRQMGEARSEIHQLGTYSKKAWPKQGEPRQPGYTHKSLQRL